MQSGVQGSAASRFLPISLWQLWQMPYSPLTILFTARVDLKELIALGIGQAEQKFLGIGAFGLVGQVLGDIRFDQLALILGFAQLVDDFVAADQKIFLDDVQLFFVHDASFIWHKIFLS